MKFIFAFVTIFCLNLCGSSFAADGAISLNQENFASTIGSENVFVLFFKNGEFADIRRFWNEVANQDLKSRVKVATVECSDYPKICEVEQISELLTIKFYGNESESFNHASVLNYLQNTIKKAITHYKTENQALSSVENGTFLVKFYAPACLNCIKISSLWDEVESIYANRSDFKTATIDCSETKQTCKHFGIRKYPMFAWIVNGEITKTLEEHKTRENLLEFIEGNIEKPTTPAPRTRKIKGNGKVVPLTPTDFNEAISVGFTFVMFELKSCSHCLAIVGIWAEMAQNVTDLPEVLVGEMDCGHYYHFCTTQKANGYPTLIAYKDGEVFLYDYTEDYTTQGFTDWARCSVAGGAVYEKWMEDEKEKKRLRRERKKARKAAEVAAAEAEAAANATAITTEVANATAPTTVAA